MSDAHVGVETGHDDGVDLELIQEYLQVGSVETAVPPLGNNVIDIRRCDLGNDLCPGGARDGVVSPEFQFLVDPLDVGIVGVDDVDSFLPGLFDQFLHRGDDALCTVAFQRSGNEVVQHIYDDDRGAILHRWGVE